MTTLILVLLCLAIAGRELYLASDKRLPRAQAELRRLDDEVVRLAEGLEAVRAQVAALPPHAPSNVPAAPAAPPVAAEPDAGTVHEMFDRLGAIEDRLDRLDQEITALSGQLAGLELDRDAQRALARSLDAVEEVTWELRREMLDRLAREEGVVTGLLLSERGEAEALLAEAYERAAAEFGLRVRVRDRRDAEAANGGYRGTAFQLSGRRPDALAEELLTYARGLYDPQDPSALATLLTELAHLRGGGVARLGAFTAVRTPTALICGLLPDGGGAGARPADEPWDLAARLRDLPDERRCDLSWLCSDQ
ncbi:hypothetical protein Acsp04_46400 [Actinomadura sp. NBRC 104425]|uniref:hypothetical protein n=1 Tax=Actinomadura sp. NBRC 104425 TaxID=3032204 RepID=UPI0024A360D2|nr:hypothetical protein [Actinomadura sp. NBRC 104425]GLZ14405.1 hypothetical protein Acsp04_46400 [Actinomadura sp. NBRC 104425]